MPMRPMQHITFSQQGANISTRNLPYFRSVSRRPTSPLLTSGRGQQDFVRSDDSNDTGSISQHIQAVENLDMNDSNGGGDGSGGGGGGGNGGGPTSTSTSNDDSDRRGSNSETSSLDPKQYPMWLKVCVISILQ